MIYVSQNLYNIKTAANIIGCFGLGGVVENVRTKFVRLALNKGLFIPDLR